MKHFDIQVSGHVQGVNFRTEAKRLADELGVFGIAKNGPNDSVYLEVEGEDGLVEKFLAWCAQGPVSAEVDVVETTEGTVQGYDKFIIKYQP